MSNSNDLNKKSNTNSDSNPNVVLFYPQLGWMDTFILDLPLSLIYVAFDCYKNGIEVRIVDQRIEKTNWKKALSNAIDENTTLVGFSVMSGNPILNALEATKFVKEKFPSIITVWGGMHVTICPKEVIEDVNIDYIIRGLASKSLYKLICFLTSKTFNNSNSLAITEIEGLGYKIDNKVHMNEMSTTTEYPSLNELNFSGVTLDNYTRFNYKDKVYSLFTSFGCPHKCRFCFAPIFWKDIKGKKWFPYKEDEVISHIVYMIKTHNIGYVSLLDENFFLDLKRAENILRGILNAGVKVSWGIRGARVDDLARMSDEMLALLEEIGVRQIMIGAESGSDRMLQLMKKGITVDQIILANKKLSHFPSINPSYNFLSGLPDENSEDIYKTAKLADQLIRDNPNASFSGLNQLIPFPGSELYDRCIELGHIPPKNLSDWGKVDTHYNKGKTPWIDKKTKNTLQSVQAALMFIDKKIARELIISSNSNNNSSSSNSSSKVALSKKFIYASIILAGKLYRPFALFRVRHSFFKFPVDYFFIKLGVTAMETFSKSTSRK
ncbi:MAG: B12-binding domain-containing radical SAM protein [Oligoflexia bacterium]|nr:B12-binding domain-containing radical SAM protein [Oligoflexia bacterium]